MNRIRNWGSWTSLDGRYRNLIGCEVPIKSWIVDHHLRDFLEDDFLHDALFHFLSGESIDTGILSLDLISKIPMGEEFQSCRKESLVVVIQHMVHADVVMVDISVTCHVGTGPRLDDFRMPIPTPPRSKIFIRSSGSLHNLARLSASCGP